MALPAPPVRDGSSVFVGDTLGDSVAEGAGERDGESVGEGELVGVR